MLLKITCTKCKHTFTIEPTTAIHKINQLEKEVRDLKAKIAAMEAMKKGNPLGELGRMMGMED